MLIPFLKKAIENIRQFDTKILEGSLTLMLYLKAIKVWGKDAIDLFWSDESELSDFIRLCRRKRPYKRLAEAVLNFVSRVSKKTW